jgi:hypothetical protein
MSTRSQQERFERFVAKHPHDHTHFWRRPAATRRGFFRLVGAGVSGCFFTGERLLAQQTYPWTAASVETQNRARNLVFVLLAGAASHTDTFDLKVVPGVTPNDLRPESINGILFPVGILPRTAEHLGRIAIVRSVRSWSAVHGLAQTWTQIGRNPISAFGRIAPHIGSVAAIEKDRERTPGQIFPSFLGINVGNSPGSGFFPSQYAPFKFGAAAGGLGNTAHPGGAARFGDRWNLLQVLDEPLRRNSPLGKPAEDLDDVYESARGLMYNPAAEQAFRFTTADSQRYGNTAFGNALLVAKQVLAANQGTRVIQVNLGGWDMHSNIYDRNAANGLFRLSRTFDDGFGAFLSDMAGSGLLDETLVVVMGEFGRTVGPLTAQNGRDHFLQQFVVFAGGGVQGGRAIGETNPTGAFTAEPGWSRQRDVRIEDIEATIYSALGINWTTIRFDDPFKRGFEYVPFARDDVYGPINELWA